VVAVGYRHERKKAKVEAVYGYWHKVVYQHLRFVALEPKAAAHR